MAFTALATKVYKDPLTVNWMNSIKGNFDEFYQKNIIQAYINLDTSAATMTSRGSVNIASFTDLGVGMFRITYTTGFSSTAQAFGCNSQKTAGEFTTVNFRSGTNPDTGSCDFMIGSVVNDTEVDNGMVTIMVIGTLK